VIRRAVAVLGKERFGRGREAVERVAFEESGGHRRRRVYSWAERALEKVILTPRGPASRR
jgi:hypothetical protein